MITYQLLWQKSFTHPIYRIASLDLNKDGIEELIVSTQYGVHILQVTIKIKFLNVYLLIFCLFMKYVFLFFFKPNLNKAKEQLLKILNEIDILNKKYKKIK
jgi:hypothetical protein